MKIYLLKQTSKIVKVLPLISEKFAISYILIKAQKTVLCLDGVFNNDNNLSSIQHTQVPYTALHILSATVLQNCVTLCATDIYWALLVLQYVCNIPPTLITPLINKLQLVQMQPLEFLLEPGNMTI